ncbi:hypothetical protein K440DRAFT_641504 [Wilcoxina mikolae CBS 423.85]|nr:hypothetical protein K440DRAFT_641504 [Wilcoxina mikolae CBS 423.85]
MWIYKFSALKSHNSKICGKFGRYYIAAMELLTVAGAEVRYRILPTYKASPILKTILLAIRFMKGPARTKLNDSIIQYAAELLSTDIQTLSESERIQRIMFLVGAYCGHLNIQDIQSANKQSYSPGFHVIVNGNRHTFNLLEGSDADASLIRASLVGYFSKLEDWQRYLEEDLDSETLSFILYKLSFQVPAENFALLISHGADVNYCHHYDTLDVNSLDVHPRTSLGQAVYCRRMDNMRTLIEAGTDVLLDTEHSGTLSMIARRLAQNSREEPDRGQYLELAEILEKLEIEAREKAGLSDLPDPELLGLYPARNLKKPYTYRG